MAAATPGPASLRLELAGPWLARLDATAQPLLAGRQTGRVWPGPMARAYGQGAAGRGCQTDKMPRLGMGSGEQNNVKCLGTE